VVDEHVRTKLTLVKPLHTYNLHR